MDIISHGLWAGAAAKGINKKWGEKGGPGRRLEPWLAVFWGMFPDMFAFAPLFAWFAWGMMAGEIPWSQLPRPHELEPSPFDTLPIFHLTSFLYQLTHSAVPFAVTFVLVWFLRRRKGQAVPWELGGWLLHIMLDVPTHTYGAYPTPVLWPLSSWRFDGFSWATPWFFFLNYAVIAIIYLLLRERREQPQSEPEAESAESLAALSVKESE